MACRHCTTYEANAYPGPCTRWDQNREVGQLVAPATQRGVTSGAELRKRGNLLSLLSDALLVEHAVLRTSHAYLVAKEIEQGGE